MIDISFKKNSYLFYVYGCLPACVSVCHMPAVPAEAGRGCGVAWMWVLVIEPRSSARSVSALNCQASFLALCKHFCITLEFQDANNKRTISEPQKSPFTVSFHLIMYFSLWIYAPWAILRNAACTSGSPHSIGFISSFVVGGCSSFLSASVIKLSDWKQGRKGLTSAHSFKSQTITEGSQGRDCTRHNACWFIGRTMLSYLSSKSQDYLCGEWWCPQWPGTSYIN